MLNKPSNNHLPYYFHQPSAVHPYEPTAAKGHLVQNPGFMALMKDPELGKVRERKGKKNRISWGKTATC